ncbi:MAG: hypothetical protein D6748_10320 [Calditrichaeota bacterium]|nr:MAG: hypothetical protein D6748_10320 [Calditrichota bacterium]
MSNTHQGNHPILLFWKFIGINQIRNRGYALSPIALFVASGENIGNLWPGYSGYWLLVGACGKAGSGDPGEVGNTRYWPDKSACQKPVNHASRITLHGR